MRGNPFFRLIVTLGIMILIGFSVRLLVSQRNASPPPEPKKTDTSKPSESSLELVLLSSQPWEKCQVHFLEHTLIDSKSGNAKEKQIVSLPLGSPADIVIDAEWRGTENHALRIQILQNGIVLFETTLWGNQNLQDVITIPAQKSL